MELRHLRYFKAVAELLHFSRAAEHMHVTQPALSRQIRGLEEEIGTQLLERNRVHVRLTDAGRAFHAQTCKILAQVDMAVATAHEVTEGVGGELIVCTDWIIGGRIVAAALDKFRTKHPRVEVVLQDRRIHDQVRLILDGQVHLGFIVQNMVPKHQELQTMLLSRSRLGVLLPPAHALAGRRSVRLAELARETWISTDPHEMPDYVNYLKRMCRLSGFAPHLGMSATTFEGIVGRVASGYGVALMPEHLMTPLVGQLAFVTTDCSPIELCAVWQARNQSKLLQQFLAILRRHAAQAGMKPARPSLPRERGASLAAR